jgi:hypothetical protein
MNTSVVYFLGFVLVIAGLAYAAITLGVPDVWVIIGGIILLGVGLMSTVTRPGGRGLAEMGKSPGPRQSGKTKSHRALPFRSR